MNRESRPFPSPGGTAWRVAAGLMALQVVIVCGFALFFAIELSQGLGADRTQVVMSILVYLVGAAGLGLLARGLWRGRRWTRTPSVLWNVLLLPVAVSLEQNGQLAISLAVGAVAVGTIAAVLVAARSAALTAPSRRSER